MTQSSPLDTFEDMVQRLTQATNLYPSALIMQLSPGIPRHNAAPGSSCQSTERYLTGKRLDTVLDQAREGTREGTMALSLCAQCEWDDLLVSERDLDSFSSEPGPVGWISARALIDKLEEAQTLADGIKTLAQCDRLVNLAGELVKHVPMLEYSRLSDLLTSMRSALALPAVAQEYESRLLEELVSALLGPNKALKLPLSCDALSVARARYAAELRELLRADSSLFLVALETRHGQEDPLLASYLATKKLGQAYCLPRVALNTLQLQSGNASCVVGPEVSGDTSATLEAFAALYDPYSSAYSTLERALEAARAL